MSNTKHKQIWPTTVDNPWDPFTQWDKWYELDEKYGYHTCSRIARIMRPSNDLTDDEYKDAFEQACNTLVTMYHPFEVYALAVEGNTRKF